MVCGIDFTDRDIRIGKIAFQSVPFRVGFKFGVIDGHFNVTLHPKELVIATLVDIILRESSATIGLFQTTYSLFPIIGILAGAVVGISDQQPLSVTFVIFDHPAVNLRLSKYPFLYLPVLPQFS